MEAGKGHKQSEDLIDSFCDTAVRLNSRVCRIHLTDLHATSGGWRGGGRHRVPTVIVSKPSWRTLRRCSEAKVLNVSH